jgi:hypothetical protein
MIIASVGVEVEVKQVRALGCYQIMFMIPDVRENSSAGARSGMGSEVF